MTERDTHFQGFATLQMPELDSLFAVLYHAYATGDMAKRDEYSQHIETYLAQRAFDLVQHAAEHIYKEAIYTQAPNYDKFMLAIVPDLTAWPEQT